jgi:hypothetical protein
MNPKRIQHGDRKGIEIKKFDQTTESMQYGENFNLSWDEVDGIMQRAVKRGLERRGETKPKNIGIDETSFRKRHDYVTVINGLIAHIYPLRPASVSFRRGFTPSRRLHP